MKPRLPLVAPLLLLACLAEARPIPALQDVSDFEKRIARINDQIETLKAKIRTEESREATILSSLSRIALTKKLIQRELEANAVAFEKTTSELKALRAETTRRRAILEAEKQAVEKTLVTLYKFGRFDFLQTVLKAGDIGTLFAESKHLSILARYQETTISRFLSDLAELGAAQNRLETKTRDIAGLIRASQAKKLELEGQEKKSRDLIAGIQKNKQTYGQALEEYEESARQLQALMKKIIDHEYALPVPFVPLYEKKGQLLWPIQGRVITGFGLQRHPQFNTSTVNNGVEIVPAKGQESIRAVHAGRVVYADAFEGYGNLIIIDHGLAYYSLYGHCSEFRSSLGDLVTAGQTIALVGDSGSIRGECLYFELRFKTKALDPLQWLRRR
jgi:murein hydrolase activator